MRDAAGFLDGRMSDKAAPAQKEAIAELEKIWDVVVPFNLLLAHDLASETAIVNVLKPDGSREHGELEPLGKIFDWFDNLQKIKTQGETARNSANPAPPVPSVPPAPLAPEPAKLRDTHEEDAQLAELQERTSRRTELLKTKAEMELQQLEKQPPPAQAAPADPKNAQPKQPDPEKTKEGLRKAIELAPKAVEHEESALKALRKSDRPTATPEAEEAKRILEEILKAQPHDAQKDQQDQQKKEQEKKDQQKKDQEQKDKQKQDQKDKQDQDKKDQDQQKKDQDKQEKDKQEQQKQEQEKKDKQQMSREQAEAILRKVREREQKHRKDKEEQARILGGSNTVDKDW
jgi:hypothetical protein